MEPNTILAEMEIIHGEIVEEVSNCCNAKIVWTDICNDCKEHCGTVYCFEDGFACDDEGQEN